MAFRCAGRMGLEGIFTDLRKWLEIYGINLIGIHLPPHRIRVYVIFSTLTIQIKPNEGKYTGPMDPSWDIFHFSGDMDWFHQRIDLESHQCDVNGKFDQQSPST